MTEMTIPEGSPTRKPTPWKIIIPVAIVVTLCCLCLVVVGVLAYMGSQGNGPFASLQESLSPGAAIEGDWTLWFDWDCDGGYSTVKISFFADHTFWIEDNSSTSGTWQSSGGDIDFIFDEWPNTHYLVAVMSGTTRMEGTMDNLDDMTGCWYAER